MRYSRFRATVQGHEPPTRPCRDDKGRVTKPKKPQPSRKAVVIKSESGPGLSAYTQVRAGACRRPCASLPGRSSHPLRPRPPMKLGMISTRASSRPVAMICRTSLPSAQQPWRGKVPRLASPRAPARAPTSTTLLCLRLSTEWMLPTTWARIGMTRACTRSDSQLEIMSLATSAMATR